MFPSWLLGRLAAVAPSYQDCFVRAMMSIGAPLTNLSYCISNDLKNILLKAPRTRARTLTGL